MHTKSLQNSRTHENNNYSLNAKYTYQLQPWIGCISSYATLVVVIPGHHDVTIHAPTRAPTTRGTHVTQDTDLISIYNVNLLLCILYEHKNLLLNLLLYICHRCTHTHNINHGEN